MLPHRVLVVIECDTGCEVCHEDDTETVICDSCYENGYIQNADSEVGECIGKGLNLQGRPMIDVDELRITLLLVAACASNCQTCSLNEDLTTTCSACYSYQGLGIRGYYLKKEDKSCKSISL